VLAAIAVAEDVSVVDSSGSVVATAVVNVSVVSAAGVVVALLVVDFSMVGVLLTVPALVVADLVGAVVEICVRTVAIGVAVIVVVVIVVVVVWVVIVDVVVAGHASSPAIQSVAPTHAFPNLFVGVSTL